ncbi:hypothetical protein B0H21DRAFT_672254, partial [Amylocystis lapponica]
ITGDNASNNNSTADKIEAILQRRLLVDDWTALEYRLGCLAHTVGLGIEEFMKMITQVGVIESRQAIWDFDP